MSKRLQKNFQKYRFERKIGKGAFGQVYLSHHKQHKVKVAVKEINKQKFCKKMQQQFLEEIEVLQKLLHPNIIKIFEVFEEQNKIYIVMEYAQNGNFYNVMLKNGGHFTEEQARYYFRQLIQGVEFCHQKGIAHKDLKLENILLGQNNILKIIDFGLSNFLKPGEFEFELRGTLRYSDPQSLMHKPHSAEQSDLWSCGIILFNFLCGFVPFEDDFLGLVFQKMQNLQDEIPNNLSDNAKNLLLNMLNFDPQNRMTISEIKTHPWFCYESLPQQIGSSFFDPNVQKQSVLLDSYQQRIFKNLNQSSVQSLKSDENISQDLEHEVCYQIIEKIEDNFKVQNQQRKMISSLSQNLFQNQQRSLQFMHKYNLVKGLKEQNFFFGFSCSHHTALNIQKILIFGNKKGLKITVLNNKQFLFQASNTKNIEQKFNFQFFKKSDKNFICFVNKSYPNFTFVCLIRQMSILFNQFIVKI